MSESKRSLLILLALWAFFFTLVTWIVWPAWPYVQLWIALGATVFAVAIGSLVHGHFQPEPAPDFLRLLRAPKFGKDGFWVCPMMSSLDGDLALMCVYFQNNYASRCEGSVCFRPARSLWNGRRPALSIVRFDIACLPEEFGIAYVPIGLPVSLQGKTVSLEIGMTVRREKDWGRQVRRRRWEFVRADVRFESVMHGVMNVFHLVHAVTNPLFVLFMLGSDQVECHLRTPVGVEPDVPPDLTPIIKTLWLPGQEPWVPPEFEKLR